MTGLESILAQITGDAAQEAEKLLAQGWQEAAASLDAAKAEAEKKAQEILDQGEARALAIRERAASAAQLKQRNRMLAFKQQLIEEALSAGLSSLEEAPAEDYFAALLGLAARWWGSRAIRGVSIQVECPRPRLFPGQQTQLIYHLENGKSLPLIWLELSQNAPEEGCLTPDDAFESYLQPAPDQEGGAPVPALRQSFSFVGSWQTIQVESTWTAQRRGLYRVHRLVARSGDGFGLVQGEQPLPAGQIPAIAVYPRPVEVDLSLFLRPQWDCAAGRQGWMEDNTVLRGCREYQPGDSWKHINWRMAAREQGTPVNLYQTIQPRGLRFLLDGESFCGLSQDWRELEGALEVLASVLSGLSGAGVDCSLSLPHSRLFGPMTVSSGEGGGDDLLFYLAGYRCLAQRVPEESRSPQGPAFLPSRFAADAAPQSGTAYLITCSGSRLPAALMERLDPGQLWVLCAQDWEVPARAGFRSLSLDSLRKGGSRP